MSLGWKLLRNYSQLLTHRILETRTGARNIDDLSFLAFPILSLYLCLPALEARLQFF